MRRLVALIASLVVAATVLALSPSPAPAGESSRHSGDRLTADLVDDGEQLFGVGCASCHGAAGEGAPNGPSLTAAGAAAADFYLRTGRMPFAGQPGDQAQRKPPAYDDASIRALTAYVASLGDGPPIPEAHPAGALLPRGNELYVANCAACHGATAHGGAVGGGNIAPALDAADALTIAEAMIIGPGQMPIFDLPAEDRDAIVTYVEQLRAQADPGGLEIGGIGPVAEGLVAWVVGIGALLLVVVLVGRDWQRGETPDA